MSTTIQELTHIGYASPTGWIRLKTGSYADPNMLMGADGKPLTNINFYQGLLAAQKLGLRPTDDLEYNDLVNSSPEAAEQMRKYAAWTSFLRNVEMDAKSGGYTAKHTARPEVSIKDGVCIVGGAEKPIKLPKDGVFKIKELLESDTGLPEKTYGKNILNEPCAYWTASEGPERPVFRGCWDLRERRQFFAYAGWGPLSSHSGVGVRVASDEEPKLRSPEVQMARDGMLVILDSLGDKYTDAQKIEALRAAIEGL